MPLEGKNLNIDGVSLDNGSERSGLIKVWFVASSKVNWPPILQNLMMILNSLFAARDVPI